MTLKSGQARVQFLACRNEIYDMLKFGHTLKSIHRHLTADGKISFRYETLWRFVNVKQKDRSFHVFDSLDATHPKNQSSPQKNQSCSIVQRDKSKPESKILSVDEQGINQLRFDDKELF